METKHEAVRKRPRLAAPITNVGDLEANLFAHLADDCAFKRFAGLYETSEAAIHRCSKLHAASKQGFLVGTFAAGDQRDHRWRQTRERQHRARRTLHRALARSLNRWCAASTTEAVRARPLDDLHRAPSNEPIGFASPTEVAEQI